MRCCRSRTLIDATIELGGDCYVFWGGREGYMSLLNTDMKREKEHMATMLRMARDYARSARASRATFLDRAQAHGADEAPV